MILKNSRKIHLLQYVKGALRKQRSYLDCIHINIHKNIVNDVVKNNTIADFMDCRFSLLFLVDTNSPKIIPFNNIQKNIKAIVGANN